MRGTRVECTNFTPDGDLALVATIDRFLLISPASLSIVDLCPPGFAERATTVRMVRCEVRGVDVTPQQSNRPGTIPSVAL